MRTYQIPEVPQEAANENGSNSDRKAIKNPVSKPIVLPSRIVFLTFAIDSKCFSKMCGVSRRSQSRSQSIGFEDGNTLKFFRRPRVNPLRHPRRPPLRSKNSLGGQKATVASWILCSINGKWKRDAEYKLPIKHARCSFPFSVF